MIRRHTSPFLSSFSLQQGNKRKRSNNYKAQAEVTLQIFTETILVEMIEIYLMIELKTFPRNV